MTKTFPILAAAAALSLGLTACSKPAEAPTAAAPADAPVAAAAGTTQGNAPAFAANYPGTTNSNWVEMGEKAGMFSFDTPDAPAKVGEYYSGLGSTAGLSARETGGAADVVYSASGPSGEITVAAPAAGGKTSVTVTWTKP